MSKFKFSLQDPLHQTNGSYPHFWKLSFKYVFHFLGMKKSSWQIHALKKQRYTWNITIIYLYFKAWFKHSAFSKKQMILHGAHEYPIPKICLHAGCHSCTTKRSGSNSRGGWRFFFGGGNKCTHSASKKPMTNPLGLISKNHTETFVRKWEQTTTLFFLSVFSNQNPPKHKETNFEWKGTPFFGYTLSFI